MKKRMFFVTFLFMLFAISATYALTAGDIAVIAVNTDATKNVVFVALADIPANTTISFTDNSWDATGEAWRTGEGIIEWSNTAITTAGTVVNITLGSPYTVDVGSITNNTSFNMSTSGDQVLAYEGTIAPTTNASALWLYAFSTENFVYANNSNSSDIPTALASYSVAMSASTTETDNAYFANDSTTQTAVSVSGTKAALLLLFTDNTKYYMNNTGPLTIPTYTITVNSSSVTEPTAQPTSLVFDTVTTTSFNVSFTAASPAADGYLAVRKEGSAPTSDPVDGTAYTAGNTLGDGEVVYSNSGVTFSQTSLNPSTTYYYKIYSYNGTGVSTNYLITSPLAGSQATAVGVVAPTVTTVAVTAITDTSGVSGGTISADGGASITAKGVCWNTTGTPTLSDSYTTDGTGTDAFVSTMNPLSQNQLYYVRAYATNSAGTGYGNELQFTTLKSEPADHVTNFAAGTATSGTIPLIWTDATADGYLLKGSTVSAFDIIPPVDGTTESNSLLVRNVAQGLQTYTFTGLDPSTTYYFRIYPYNNGGTDIDYKIGGIVPTVTEATTAVSTALYPGDIAILAVNTDTPDSVEFVALADIPEGTVITFTDNAWSATTGPFFTNEGYLEWTCPGGGITKGTVVSLPTVGTMSLSTSGDNIIAFEGTWAERPTSENDSRFLYVFSTEAFIDAGTPTTNQTYVPAALTDYSVAMTLTGTEVDNAYFANGATAQTAVSVTGTKTELLALFTDYTLYYTEDALLTFPTYTITVGTAGPVTEPTAQPTSLVFSSVGANSFTVSYTEASPAVDGYIAIRRTGSAPTSDPVDGTSYVVGNTLGDGTVVFRGSSTSFGQASLSPSTTYYYKIYSFNGSGTATNYLVTSPLAGNQTTTASDPFGGYYTSVAGLSGASLKAGLHTLIKNTHTTEFSYTAVTDEIKYTDEDSTNTSNVIEIYTGWSIPKANYGAGTADWNKEHVWSKSHGDFGDVAPAGTDLHHLRPSDSTVNSQKSNRDFDEATTAYTDASPYNGYSGVTGCYYDTNIWEPREVEKGDVARMILYMATRYEGTDTSYDLEPVDYTFSSPSGEPYYGKLSTLLTWHNADPPDALEARRNNRIQERQGNRNPFIDHPEYVTSIWGGTVAPSVTTDAITSIGLTTATGGGEVTDGGSSTVTARGVCWNTSGSPTLSDSYTTDGTGTGVFVSSLTPLSSGQLYYVRAYASNSVGTTYGNEVSFTTLKAEPTDHVASFTAGTPTTTTIPLTWTDAARVTPDGYLIKGSSVGFGDIAAPVDGTEEANAALVQNVTQGTQTYTFMGLDSSTTYYFKIYPYTNSGTAIDYKTDGTVPADSALTDTPEASVLLVEDFDYTAAVTLTSTGNWTAHSASGTNPSVVAADNLTYANYIADAGNCATTVFSGSAEDVNRVFAAQTTGNIYAAFLVNLTSFPNTTGDYFMHLSTNPLSSFSGRIFANKNAGDSVRFGISKASTSPAYTGYDYSLGTTYLIAIKYSIIDGASNNTVDMWVNPVITGSEPTPLISAADVTGTDVANIGSIAIRQGTNTPITKIDGIRIAQSWELLFPSVTAPYINVTGTLDPFTAVVGTPSAAQTYTVTGTNLTSNITVTAPTGFELSLTGSRTWGSSVEVPQSGGDADATVYVRFNPSSGGAYPAADITHTATGATTVNQSVSGTAYTGKIIVTESLIPFVSIVGTPTAAQTYHVTGSTLSNFIDLTVAGPFQIMDTTHPSPTWETTLSLAPDFDGDIDVRNNPTVAGAQVGTITHSIDGGEAETVVVDLSGNATDPDPVVTVEPASMIFSAASGSSSTQMATITGANLSSLINVASTGEYTFAATEGGTYSNPYQITTGYNGTNDLWIKFSPTSQGTFNDEIIITSGAVGDTLAATGYGLDPGEIYATDLFFSEYIEGSSNNKAIEIFNGTGHPVDLSDYSVVLFSNGSATPNYTLVMSGILANNDVYVIANSSAMQAILDSADVTSTVTYYNGDDALAIWKNADSSYVDIFGRIGDDPGSAWTGDGGYTTVNATLIRKSSVEGGVTVNPTGTGPTAFTTLTTEWDLYAIDYISNLGIHTFTPGLTPAEAPVILPADGYQTAPIWVTMSTTTPGGVIRYTTDGNDPTETSTIYTDSISVSTTTTVKAITYASGYAPSSVSVANYNYATEIADIATLRAQATGSTYYKLTGEAVLTLKTATRNAKYIQDSTGAILIDDNNGIITTTYNLGDGITNIVGTLGYYASMLQFTPVADPGTATSTGNVITPEDVTLLNLDTTYQAKLVKLTGVSFSVGGNFVASTNYSIQDASGTGIARTQYSDLDYIGTAVPTTPKTIVGVVLQYNTTTQFVPRSLAEFTDAAPPAAPLNVVITIVGNDVHLDWDAVAGATSYTVYRSDDAYAGFTIVATPATNSAVLTGVAATFDKRFYYVTANN